MIIRSLPFCRMRQRLASRSPLKLTMQVKSLVWPVVRTALQAWWKRWAKLSTNNPVMWALIRVSDSGWVLLRIFRIRPSGSIQTTVVPFFSKIDWGLVFLVVLGSAFSGCPLLRLYWSGLGSSVACSAIGRVGG